MSNAFPLSANEVALRSLFKVEPLLSSIGVAEEMLGLEPFVALHAGPPLKTDAELPQTIKSSLVLSALYEGWAKDTDDALRLIESGKIHLKPAQEHHCVTPLAALITQKTSLLGVTDQNSDLPCIFTPLSSGPPPDIRFGALNLDILNTLELRDTTLFRIVRAALKDAIKVRPLALMGLKRGDELHSNTSGATEALREQLWDQLYEMNIDETDRIYLSDLMRKNPGFFLTIWMATCKLYLTSMEGVTGSSILTRMGANAQSVGYSTSDSPDKWVIYDAEPPKGNRFEHVSKEVPVEGVIGDSCVIDIMGFGGQITQHSPEVFETLCPFLPQDLQNRTNSIMTTTHPHFKEIPKSNGFFDIQVGLDLEKMRMHRISPLVNIGMLANDGKAGLLGRGLFSSSQAFF